MDIYKEGLVGNIWNNPMKPVPPHQLHPKQVAAVVAVVVLYFHIGFWFVDSIFAIN